MVNHNANSDDYFQMDCGTGARVVSDSWWKLVLGVAPDHDGCAIRRRGQSGCLTGAWMVWRLHILLTPLTAIPAAQADAGQRHPQRSEGTDKLPLPVAVAIALGRAALR